MQDYVAILNSFYGYFGGLEKLIERYINESNLADYGDRRKSAALADDIKALGGDVATMANGTELPELNNYLQAFGALYVIEGSTLGGQIISRMIQQHIRIENGFGLSFFNSYGDNTHQMWAKFKDILNKVAVSEADEQIVLAAANQTFLKFKDWLEK
jgi:heme oxygenase